MRHTWVWLVMLVVGCGEIAEPERATVETLGHAVFESTTSTELPPPPTQPPVVAEVFDGVAAEVIRWCDPAPLEHVYVPGVSIAFRWPVDSTDDCDMAVLAGMDALDVGHAVADDTWRSNWPEPTLTIGRSGVYAMSIEQGPADTWAVVFTVVAD